MDPLRAMPDEDYRFSLGLMPISAAEFFTPTPVDAASLKERRAWLTSDPDPYVAAPAPAASLITRFGDWVAPYRQPTTAASLAADPRAAVIELGSSLVADFVLLDPDADGALRVAAGCVCFPSSWRLHDKVGMTLEDVHAVVPGLNAALGGRIDQLLAGLKPGKCIGRSNWGLAASSELNQHSDRGLPAPTAETPPAELWLRREDQLLAALPDARGIVFGIRIEQTALTTILRSPVWSQRLARGLATMPVEMLEYKRLQDVQPALLARLHRAVTDG